VLMAKQLGADGVVFGLLDADANVDVQRTRQLVDLAKPLRTTFHRAFDISADLGRSLEDIVESGADRILTSGGAETAVGGAAALHDLVKRAGDRVIVMACGGIDDQSVQAVLETTGVREIHAGLRTPVESRMRYRSESISMGISEGSEYRRFVVRETRVAQLVRADATLLLLGSSGAWVTTSAGCRFVVLRLALGWLNVPAL